MAEKNDGIACPLVLIGTFLLVLLLFWGRGQMGGMMGWGGMMYGWNGNGMMGGNSLLLNVFFWVGIIVLVWWALKLAVRRGTEKPIEILNRRYAAGEIGKTEYLRMKHEISK